MSSQNLYERITSSIIADLETGVRPWMKPWDASKAVGPARIPRRHNGEPYHGINILMLWDAAARRGYRSPFWLTFRQAQDMDAFVRKGERGTLVIYANRLTRTETDDQGKEYETTIPFVRGYSVFNAEQIEDLPAHFFPAAPAPADEGEQVASAVRFLEKTGARVNHGGDRAFYSLSSDCIGMPHPEAFRDGSAYVATRAHETAHWTRHPSRLNRDFGQARFGDNGYAREELVAELASAFLCADLSVTPEVLPEHAEYIGEWLTILKHDKRLIVSAASHAQKAVEHLYNRTGAVAV